MTILLFLSRVVDTEEKKLLKVREGSDLPFKGYRVTFNCE